MPNEEQNGSDSGQNVSEKSEQIQEKSEKELPLPSENENGEPENSEPEGSDAENDELPLPEPDVAEQEDADEKKKSSQPKWLQKKLERERRKEAERIAEQRAESERLRIENERLKAASQQNQNQQPAIDPYLPQRDHFQSDSEYFIALADYREERRNQEQLFHARQAEIQKHEKRFQDGLKDAVEGGKAKYKDFEEKTDYILYGDGFPSNRAMAEAIVESEYKDDILYFLGSHEKEAERIARLNPIQAAKEIARIEVRFQSRKKSSITKAPKMLAPLSGGQGSAVHGDPNKMDMDTFRQWYKDKFG